MPWKETCPMDEKLRFIAACSQEPNLSEVCRRFEISRKTAYKWLARYDALGLDGLKDRPPIVPAPPHRLAPDLESAIVRLRKACPNWGPKKLLTLLLEAEPHKPWPAASTIGEVLKRNGLIRPRRRRVRVAPGTSPLSPCEEPNELWCIDFKGHFALGDKTRCHPLTLSDGASRFLLKCEGLAQPREKPVREHLELAFREYGLPNRIRSDNGPPFATLAAGGLSALSIWWIKLGIVPERIEPGHPEQNGRHERMHRTLKAEVAPRKDLAEQQLAFDAFRYAYNELRPHEALGQVPPAKRYEPSRRCYPEKTAAIEYEDCKVRWAHNGLLSWRGQAVKVGPPALSNEPVGMKQVSESEWEVYFGPVLLGRFDDRDREPVLRRASPKVAGTDDRGAGKCVNSASGGEDIVAVEPDHAASSSASGDEATGLRHPASATVATERTIMEVSETESVT
jgi:transposase InsO family protein